MTSKPNTLGSVDATTAILEAELPRLEEHQQHLERKLATVTERLESVRAALAALRVLSAAPPVSLSVVTEDKSPAVLVPAARTEAEPESKPEPEPEPASEPAQAEETVAAPAGRRTARATAARAAAKTPRAPKTPRTPGAAAKRKQKATEGAAPAAEKPATAKSRRTTAGKGKAAAATGQKVGDKTSAPTAPAGDNGNLTAQVMAVVNASGSTPVRARDVAEALGRELTTGSINTVRSTLDRLVATSRAHRAGRGLYQAPIN